MPCNHLILCRPFSSCPQSFPAPGSFPMSRLFASGDQSAGVQTCALPILLKLMSIESVVPSNHLILCRPLLLPPPIFPSIRVFSNESLLRIRWPKYWSFSFSISPSNEHSGLISFRIDWFDLLPVQGTLKIVLQHHSLKASILQHSAFLRFNSHIHTCVFLFLTYFTLYNSLWVHPPH